MIATFESVLLYGCETWILTNSLLKNLDGTYNTILRMVLNIHWTNKIKNEILYGELERLSEEEDTSLPAIAYEEKTRYFLIWFCGS